ncbi:hypothetical protein [Paenibacillus sp. YN15]|uniref:hypothetical protein n=1 Tax=Paenibacillus sp. YN15 TaxID=1742774 RepID=UPI000DCDEF47|nr:hypothetical protein [Paenibacillus sp. YN15]RAV06606.1 hypothetical protein DQG13_01910 [Paenibacillus sp. YN15]
MLQNGILDFLKDYPGMTIAPSRENDTILKGLFKFKAKVEGLPEIEDSYSLSIRIPSKFPFHIPIVEEDGGKIPRDHNYHINPDNTLCLGSPLRLFKKLSRNPTINVFAEECLVPYLYAVSYKLQNGGSFIFGELAHGQKGIIYDYTQLLGLTTRDQVIYALRLLGVNKRLANKQACPCKCGKRLGACNFRKVLNQYRQIAPSSYYREQLQNIKGY